MALKLKYRCGRAGCRRIYHLTKPPEQYIKTRVCACGGKLGDYSSDRKRNKARTCCCDGLPHPHRKRSSVWCDEHPTGPTEQDHIERYGQQPEYG